MIPIIFIHNQNSSYLPLSLWQARKSNPDSEIILIGDRENAHFHYLVTHVDKKDYLSGAIEFGKRFVNFSTNSHEFELICLQRWFILEEYMRKNGIEKCLYLDSDILLFGNSNEDADRFKYFGMTIAGISGHSNFINDIDILTDFCQYIGKSYENEAAIQVLASKYKVFRENHEAGGISDMTFFVEYKELHPECILDISEPISDKMYDISMSYIENVQNYNGIKMVYPNKFGDIYIRHHERPLIQMQSLHFQGESKKHMKRHLFSNSFALNVLYQANKLYIFMWKVWKKTFGRLL